MVIEGDDLERTMARRVAALGWLTMSVVLAAAAIAPAGAVEAVAIENGMVRVSVDAEAGKFEIARVGGAGTGGGARGGGTVFVREGKLVAGGRAGTAEVMDKMFGGGKSILIERVDGSADSLSVFPKLPFVVLRSTLSNVTKEAVVINKVRPAEFAVDLGKAAAELKVVGTGGLAAGDKALGSYMWLAVADPTTRAGVVAGWVSSERGSGVILPTATATEGAGAESKGGVHLAAQIDYGHLHLRAGELQRAETLVIGYFEDVRLGLEAWADAVARVYNIHLPPEPAGYCTWYHAGASNAEKLAEQAAFAEKALKPFGFNFVQIDDGWQDGEKLNGPRKNFTRVRPKGPYPEGMKPTADMIQARGMTAGIWFMPFAGTFDDPWFKDHPDWFAHRADGKAYDVKWGGTALDMTHPEVQKYVAENVRRITKDWGYKYLKMDGLWMGSATEIMYVNDAYKEDKLGNATFHDPEKTNVEAFRDGLKLVRQAAGKEVFLLGCNGPQNMRSYGGAFGLLDAMRIGPDNGPGWKSLMRGPMYGGRNYHLNGRIWWNDPDPLYVRASVPMSHARAICSWITVAGQLSVSSDQFSALPAERLDLLKRTMPSHGLPARPVDLLDRAMPRVWEVSDRREKGMPRDLVGLFNWEAETAKIDEPMERLGLVADKEYAAFEYWTNALLPPVKGRLKFELEAPIKGKENQPTAAQNVCAVVALRELADHPQSISTSRHITQGLVDLSGEKWDAEKKAMSGVAQVVGGDGYELRIVMRSTAGAAGAAEAWKLAGVEVSAEDRAAGVGVEAKEEAELVRVMIKSAAGRAVKWTARFVVGK